MVIRRIVSPAPAASSADLDDVVLSLIDAFDTPDPFVLHAPNGRYYLTFTCGDRVDLLVADSLAGFRRSAHRHTLWVPPPGEPYSGDLWAPEIHLLYGRWYIYFAADDPRRGNVSHRMYVLGGPPAQYDPEAGPWEYLGPIQGLPLEQWAIDGTIFNLNSDLYFAYSGWPRGETQSDLKQEIFIAKLSSPTRASSAPVCISTPTHRWEHTRDANGLHGINEGPQFLRDPIGSWVGLAYSCAGSWTSDYKMGVLAFSGGASDDPLDPSCWTKRSTPLLQTGGVRAIAPWGPGHGNFVNLSDDTVGVFHATDGPNDGWARRKARVGRVTWAADGPHMGSNGVLGRLVNDLDAFTKARPPVGAPEGHDDGDFHRLFVGNA